MELQEIKNVFIKLGIKEGDCVMLSSDVLGIWNACREVGEEFSGEKVIQYLQEIITTQGTILIPTYNWDFSNKQKYNYIKSKSKTGMLGNVALKMENFKRTKHPLYSFAVWGKEQEKFMNMNNIDSFGSDSPFQYLHKNNAKNIILDVDFPSCFTFVHYVEQHEGVSYRFIKEFTGEYTDVNEEVSNRVYSMFVRYLELDVKFANCYNQFMCDHVIDKEVVVEDIYFRSVNFKDAYEVIKKDIKDNGAKNIVTYIGQV